MAKSCLLFLLLAGLCLSVHSQKKTISVIGSSTAAGYGLPDANGDPVTNIDGSEDDDKPVNSWANRLRRYYTTLGLLNELDNFAIWGRNIYQAMPNNSHTDDRDDPDEASNITMAFTVNPDILLINYPSNKYDELDVHEVMLRFHDLYDFATANGHTICYICTTQPRTSEGWDPSPPNTPENALANRQKLLTLRDSILAEFPGHAIDFYTPIVDMALESSPGVPNLNYLGILPQYAQGDGTHLNEDGHNVLFQQVLAKNIIPFGNLPLSIGKISVRRIDDTHITVSFTVYPNNTEKQFFIQVKDKAGNTKQVRVIIPDKTKQSQTVSETIQIY